MSTLFGEEDEVRYLQAMDISAMNGLISILILLAKRELITASELNSIHESMSKPLALEVNAHNPLVQDTQQNLDTLFAEVHRFLREGPLPKKTRKPK